MASKRTVDEYLTWMRNVRRAQAGTIEIYRLTLTTFADWFDRSWAEVTADDIEGFLLRPRRGERTAALATQQRERTTLKSFYAYAIRRGIVTEDPTFDVPMVRAKGREPKAVDDKTWQQFWDSDIPDEDRVWIGLCAFAGLRRREVVLLRPSQIDHERGLLRGVQRKGGALDTVEFAEMARIISQRLPRVLPDVDGWLSTVHWLCGVREGERSIVPHGELITEQERKWHSIHDDGMQSPKAINYQLIRLLKRAGLRPNQFTPHALRHSCATNLLRAGVPIEVVADCLGHTNPAMTMRYSKTAGRLAEWRNGL